MLKVLISFLYCDAIAVIKLESRPHLAIFQLVHQLLIVVIEDESSLSKSLIIS